MAQQNHKYFNSFCLRSQHVQELEDAINITYGFLGKVFQILDTEQNVPITQITPCLTMLSKKNESDIGNIVKKTHNFIRKTKNCLKKNPNYIEVLHPDFLEEGKEERSAGHVGVFCQNLGITAYTLENYSNFKNNFSFNNGSILEIHDFFRTRGNASFNDLCQLINTLSNQDFDELDKFKLRESLGKLKEMHARFVKVKKSIRNEKGLSEFLSSPFSPGNTLLPLAGENASLTLKKRKSLLLEKKLQEKSEKISSLQETVSVLNECIVEENQGRLKTDKELQVLSKDLKKQVKENKSLSLKLCQKKRKKKKRIKKLNTRNIDKKLNRKKFLIIV